MPGNFFPSADVALRNWAAVFSANITGRSESLGVPDPVAQALATKQAAYAVSLEAATNPTTRGESTVRAKDRDKKILVAEIRAVARFLQGSMTVTDAQREDLGLPVHDRRYPPVPVPAEKPGVGLIALDGNTLRVVLSTGAGRAKPAGVAGASLFSFVGEQVPADLSGWTFMGNTTRTTADMDFGAALQPGAKVWVTAFWYNPRGQSGDAAAPVSTRLAGGGVVNTAA